MRKEKENVCHWRNSDILSSSSVAQALYYALLSVIYFTAQPSSYETGAINIAALVGESWDSRQWFQVPLSDDNVIKSWTQASHPQWYRGQRGHKDCWPWEEYTCPNGLLMVNWAQSHNQSLAAIVHRGLSPRLHFNEKLQMGLPSFLHCAFCCLSQLS